MSAARDVLAGLRLEDGRLWIDAAEPFQLEDALAWLEGQEPYSFCTRARGTSKTCDLSAVVLSRLLATDQPERLYWLASDADQGALAISNLRGFATRTSGLAGQVDIQSRRVVALSSGAELIVLAADAPGSWGITPQFVAVDEIANWTDGPAARTLWQAASSAVAKREDARLAVITTPSNPDHWSFEVLQHARRSDLWRVSERRGPAPWINEERLTEQRERLPDAVYRQLWLGEWTAAEGSFLDPAVIDAAFKLDGPALQSSALSYVAALDLGAVNDRSVLAVGHRERGSEVVHLDRMQAWSGSRRRPVDFAEVERFIIEAHKRFRYSLRLDPWQGLDLAQRLRRAGIQTDEYNFSQASKQKLAATLLHSLNSGNLRLYEAEGLRDELLRLRLQQAASGAWSFDHKSGKHDDRATALALMTVAALDRANGGVPRSVAAHPWSGRRIRRGPLAPPPAEPKVHIPTSPPPPPEPRREGNFLIHPHRTKGGRQ